MSFEHLTEYASDVTPADDLRARLERGDKLRVKFGVDPTAPHVTLGWAVPFRRLRRFQDAGHQAVLIIGDFTAQIGDPSGQNKDRPMLTSEQVNVYVDNVLGQIGKILDMDKVEIRRNSEWLEPLGVAGILKLTSFVTVAQTLSRDDFAKRYEAKQPISVKEFIYPILQAYDSVEIDADLELGGNDQLHTFMMTRDLMEKLGKRPQAVLTMPLLRGTDGVNKMSQSRGNYIAITEAPDDMYGKIMRIPDENVAEYGRLTADLPPEAFDWLRPDLAKRRIARAVVEIYHGADAAKGADDHWDRVHVAKQLPDEIGEVKIPESTYRDGRVYLPELVAFVGFAKSNGEARRLIAQGGVRLDGEVCTDELVAPPVGRVLQVGKRQFVRLT